MGVGVPLPVLPPQASLLIGCFGESVAADESMAPTAEETRARIAHAKGTGAGAGMQAGGEDPLARATTGRAADERSSEGTRE